MASPHGAGASALIMAQHPTWSPAEVKSAIALTATPAVLREDGTTPGGPFDIGTGRIDLAGAARIGFVMHETVANYIAANPATGGQPRTLNQPSAQTWTCPGLCSFQRRLRSVLPASQQWQASIVASTGIGVSVTPAAFTLNAGDSIDLGIAVDARATPLATWTSAMVVLSPVGNPALPVARIPVIVRTTADLDTIFFNGFQ